MSTSLRDFLKEKSALYTAEAEINKLVVEEWRAAVDNLFKQLREWLVAADPEGIIQPEVGQIAVSEPGLGRYQISSLNLRVFGKWVGLIPKARKTIKRATPPQKSAPEQATGRVDITDEIRRYVLYRFTYGAGDEWFIDDPATNCELQPLTPERFESAPLSYLQ